MNEQIYSTLDALCGNGWIITMSDQGISCKKNNFVFYIMKFSLAEVISYVEQEVLSRDGRPQQTNNGTKETK